MVSRYVTHNELLARHWPAMPDTPLCVGTAAVSRRGRYTQVVGQVRNDVAQRAESGVYR